MTALFEMECFYPIETFRVVMNKFRGSVTSSCLKRLVKVAYSRVLAINVWHYDFSNFKAFNLRDMPKSLFTPEKFTSGQEKCSYATWIKNVTFDSFVKYYNIIFW